MKLIDEKKLKRYDASTSSLKFSFTHFCCFFDKGDKSKYRTAQGNFLQLKDFHYSIRLRSWNFVEMSMVFWMELLIKYFDEKQSFLKQA